MWTRAAAMALAAICVALAFGGAATGSPGQAAGKTSADARVGTVLSASGSDVYVKRSSNGKLVALRKGTVVYLHDIIAAGPGTQAKLKLTVPKGIPANTVDLLDFYKQLSSAKPDASKVANEFFIAPSALKLFHTLDVSRSGHYIDITLHH